jgi:hypothetical protein
VLREPAQRDEEILGDHALHVHAPADEDDVDRAHLVERSRRREREAVARGTGRAIEAHDGPGVDLFPAQAIGHAQRLDGARERDHRIVRQRQEGVATPGNARVQGLGLVRMGDKFVKLRRAV